MIVPMKKVFVVVRSSRKDDLLTGLRKLGVLHLAPVDASRAQADESTVTHLQRLNRAIQVLGNYEPAESAPETDADAAAERTLDLYAAIQEGRNRLGSLYREADRLEVWGDTRLEQLRTLQQAGLTLTFALADNEQIARITGDMVQTVGQAEDGRSIVAIVTRDGAEPNVPDEVERLELPPRDRPSVQAEAETIRKKLDDADAELRRLANRIDALAVRRDQVTAEAEWTIADRSGADNQDLFAVQGWVPTRQAESLQADLVERGLIAAVEVIAPEEDEQPPTLVEYPRWARPIEALFDILGTKPGYREYDLSGFFIIALPLFAAMLIGDGGYGLIFTVASFALFGKIKAKANVQAAQLLVVFSLTMLAWGVLSGNIFGVTPGDLMGAGGFWASLGNGFETVAVLWHPDADVARNIIIKLSFIFGTTHLVLAHVRQVIGLAPDQRFLAEIGWSGFLLGMLGIVWMLFFPEQIWMPNAVMLGLLIGGFALVLLFSYPSGNPVKRLALGLVANLLPSISAFSDTMSYIRLMAVGLASYYIASAFNGLAAQIAAGGGLLYVPAALIVVAAHSLNIVLGVIAIFAHGVRLNMLEFSSNAGVQWAGYAYEPFGRRVAQPAD